MNNMLILALSPPPDWRNRSCVTRDMGLFQCGCSLSAGVRRVFADYAVTKELRTSCSRMPPCVCYGFRRTLMKASGDNLKLDSHLARSVAMKPICHVSQFCE